MPVAIVEFDPPKGVFGPGATVTSSLRVRNAGSTARTFWVGFSVRDPAGEWHDAPSRQVHLGGGEEGNAEPNLWIVPSGPVATGSYHALTAVWSGRPEDGGALRLAHAEREDAFYVYRTLHRFPRLDGTAWKVGEHPLGRGMLHPDNVSTQNGQLRLRLPAGTCDGAELRSHTRHLYGSYAARLQSCPAPGSISAFFLYQDVPGGNDEIDIEIIGGEPHRAIVAAWVAGRQTQAATVALPWNPSEAPHDYTIDFHPGQLSLHADGALLARWTSGLPTEPMRVMLNAWWPTWLPWTPSPVDRCARVDWVRW